MTAARVLREKVEAQRERDAATTDAPTLFGTLRAEKKRWREALEAIAKDPCEVFPDSTCNRQRAERRCHTCIARAALRGKP